MNFTEYIDLALPNGWVGEWSRPMMNFSLRRKTY